MAREYFSEVHEDYPKVRIVGTADSEEMDVWLRRLRSQGILYKRTELYYLLHRILKAVLTCVGRERNIEGHRSWQVILVLRDALVAYHTVLEVLPEVAIGVIGHERFVVCPSCDEDMHVSLNRCRTCGSELKIEGTGMQTRTRVNFTRFEPPNRFQGIVILDLVVASGGTIDIVLDKVRSLEMVVSRVHELGRPRETIIASTILSKAGIKRLQDKVDLIYGCAVDDLVDGMWLFPGVHGDIGDILFLTQLDITTDDFPKFE